MLQWVCHTSDFSIVSGNSLGSFCQIMALTIFLVVSCDETYHDMLPSMGVAQNPF
jgi:hypothetical protein